MNGSRLGPGFEQAGDFISPEEKELSMQSLIPTNTPSWYAADPDGNVLEVQGSSIPIPVFS